MKKINFLFISIFFLGGLTSCSKFLDNKPISQRYDTGGFGGDSLLLKTASDAENAISSVYSDFKAGGPQTLYFYDWFANCDAHSDNSYAGGDSPDLVDQLMSMTTLLDQHWGFT
jgi:hypothetical protein